MWIPVAAVAAFILFDPLSGGGGGAYRGCGHVVRIGKLHFIEPCVGTTLCEKLLMRSDLGNRAFVLHLHNNH